MAEDEVIYRVDPYYKDLKEEMLNYTQLDHKSYHTVLAKAKVYIQTNIAKSLMGGIRRNGDPITMNHLISIILYCDYTNLSSEFTRTFRKSHPFEVLSQIKKRNSYYYHWSKTLRCTISKYGQNDYSSGAHSWGDRGHLPRLIGPFYCGMSVVLNITHFNMRLSSPTSTSVQLSVAMKFSGNHGMILELSNSEGDGKLVHGMDCSWISRFREEDERYVKLYSLYGNSM